MSNHSILELNTLDGFEHEDTKILYLRGIQRNELKAFWCACKWQDYIRPFVMTMIPIAMAQHADNPHCVNANATEELIDFFRERHFRSYFPNQ